MFYKNEYLNFVIFLSNSTPFQEVSKLLKLNHFFKKAPNQSSKIPLYFTSHLLSKLSKILNECSWRRRKFSTGFNWVSEKTTLQALVLKILLIKSLADLKKPFFTGMIFIGLKKAFHHIDHQWKWNI